MLVDSWTAMLYGCSKLMLGQPWFPNVEPTSCSHNLYKNTHINSVIYSTEKVCSHTCVHIMYHLPCMDRHGLLVHRIMNINFTNYYNWFNYSMFSLKCWYHHDDSTFRQFIIFPRRIFNLIWVKHFCRFTCISGELYLMCIYK